MATLEEIFNFEQQLEDGFVAILQSALGSEAQILYRRLGQAKATPFIDVLFTVGPAVRHEKERPVAVDESIYAGTLEIAVNTSRSSDTENVDHRTLISRVRVALLPSSNNYNATNFSNVAVLDITGAGSSYEVDQDTNIDTTLLNYELFFGIRDTAWPTDTEGVFASDFSTDFL